MIKREYQGIVILILIILTMLFVKIKYGYKPEKVEIETQPTPTSEISQDDYPLRLMLPYKGKGFVVDKYTAPMTLQMTITTTTKAEASKAVTEWINSFTEVKKQHKIIITN